MVLVPGSDDAIDNGCNCNVVIHGVGQEPDGDGEYWIREGCPVHNPEVPTDD